MNEPKPIIISIQSSEGDWLTIERAWDVGIDDLVADFRAILFWLEFSAETIESYVPDSRREWKYLDEDDPDDVPSEP